MRRAEEYTEHKGYRFPNTISLENLGMEMTNCYDALMKMGEKVIFTPMTYKDGNVAAVYEVVETP
jgi:hypothetical protein